MDGVRSGSFPVADCTVAGVVLRGYVARDLGILAWYVYVIVSDFMKPHFSEKNNETLLEPKSI